LEYYHVCDFDQQGKQRIPGFLKLKRFISPFVVACMAGEDTFIATVLASRYADERIMCINPEMGSIYQKMACEGIFEYVRCMEFCHYTPRYESIFLFGNKEDCKNFIRDFQKGKGIYKVTCDNVTSKYDMNLFTQAHDLMKNIYLKHEGNFNKIIELARKYWRGESPDNTVFEYLYDKPITLQGIS
jgi:hypothetical protein